MRSRLALLALLFCVSGCGARAPVASSGAKAPWVAPRVAPGDLDARILLGDLPARASLWGAGPVSIVASGESVERERLGAFVFVPADACLLAYARASSAIDDLDVAAFADAGNSIVSDDAPDAHPTVLLCPPHPERVYLSALTASGEGFVALAAQLVPLERAADVGRVLGARGASFEAWRRVEAWAGLDDRVRTHREGLGGQWEEFRRVALAVDARVPAYLHLPMEADTCIDAVIVPGDDVALLEVEAIDSEGHVLARSSGGARDRTVTLCSSLASGGSLVIRPHVGQGLAAVVLARARGEAAKDLSVRPDIAWASGSSALSASRNARNAELAKAGYSPPQATWTGTLTIGHVSTISIDLGSRDVCSRIDVVAGAPLALVEASVWDDQWTLVARGEGAASVTLFTCGRGQVVVELLGRGRGGPFALLLRPEPWNNATFAQHRLSASRMLARAAAGPSGVLEGVPVAERVAVLDAAHLLTWEETVPAGKCLRVAAGAAGEGIGLSARMIESSTGEEIDRSHADRAVALRACAAAVAARAVRIEMRASAGKLDTVIGERMTD